MRGERLRIHWDDGVLYHEKPGGGWVKVTLADGVYSYILDFE